MSKEWKLTIGTCEGKKFVNIYYKKSRFRYWNGKTIGVKLTCAENPELLKSAFEIKLLEGWRPQKRKLVKKVIKKTSPTLLSEVEKGVQRVLEGNYSHHHKRDVRWVHRELKQYLGENRLTSTKVSQLKLDVLEGFVRQSKWSDRTHKNVLTTLKCVTKGEIYQLLKGVKTRRVKSTLHKPIRDIKALLDEVKSFNDPLYVCCLLTYGCLLRPHQEIRLLKWSDVDLDRGLIALSGSRNKSGRNRIVPIPKYIEPELRSRYTSRERYVLRNSLQPYSKDYLKVLWRRYKQEATQVEDGITLYSLRHTGALRVFEKTGSLQKLQQVMGHSDMKVSLTYLRGLEVKQLDVEDLPGL
jgi:integrase